MKKIRLTSLLAFCLLLLAINSNAQLFDQDFSSSTDFTDYVSATPDNGQFNAISSTGAGTVVSINSGTLQYARSGSNAGSFSRTTDFSPVPNTLRYRVDITVSGNTTAQTSAAVFQIGSGFGTANSAESNANTYARFGINFSATTGCFSIRDISNGTSGSEFCGTQSITWILNNSGSTLNYLAPDSTPTSVDDDRADMYIGNTPILDNVNIQTTTQTMTDLKFAFLLGVGTIQIDNLLIDPTAPLSSASGTVSGRVKDFKGNGLKFVAVMITGGGLDESLYATTNQFGKYLFEDIPVGADYVLQVFSRRHSFAQSSRIVSLKDFIEDADFIGRER